LQNDFINTFCEMRGAKNATEADLMRERAFVDQVLISHNALISFRKSTPPIELSTYPLLLLLQE
jgi:hypothetical protein